MAQSRGSGLVLGEGEGSPVWTAEWWWFPQAKIREAEKTATGWSLVQQRGRSDVASLHVYFTWLVPGFFPSLYCLLASCLTWWESLSTKRTQKPPATESLIVPSWVLSLTCKAPVLSQARRRESAGTPGMSIGLTPRSSTAWIKGRKRLSSSWIPRGRDMSSTSGNGSSERGFLSFHSLSVEVLQRAVLRGGGGGSGVKWRITCTRSCDRSLATNVWWPSRARSSPELSAN